MYKPNALRSDPKPEKKEKKKRKKIRHFSIKRAKQNVQYLAKRKIHLEAFPNCQLKLEGCTFRAVEIHHFKGRIGSLLTDERYFKSTCRHCHDQVHNH